jgi:hypothetical protein
MGSKQGIVPVIIIVLKKLKTIENGLGHSNRSQETAVSSFLIPRTLPKKIR